MVDGNAMTVSPEYEDCRRIAIERDESIQVVYHMAKVQAEFEILNSTGVDRGSDSDLELVVTEFTFILTGPSGAIGSAPDL